MQASLLSAIWSSFFVSLTTAVSFGFSPGEDNHPSVRFRGGSESILRRPAPKYTTYDVLLVEDDSDEKTREVEQFKRNLKLVNEFAKKTFFNPRLILNKRLRGFAEPHARCPNCRLKPALTKIVVKLEGESNAIDDDDKQQRTNNNNNNNSKRDISPIINEEYSTFIDENDSSDDRQPHQKRSLERRQRIMPRPLRFG